MAVGLTESSAQAPSIPKPLTKSRLDVLMLLASDCLRRRAHSGFYVVEIKITLMVILQPGRVYESLATLCGAVNKVKVTTYAGHALLFCKIVLALPTLPGRLQFVPSMA